MKYSIVDVRCLDNHGRYFIVKMQIEWTKDFMQGMVYNAAATYVHQLTRGEAYKTLSLVYGLAIINDTVEKDPDWFHHFQMTFSVEYDYFEDVPGKNEMIPFWYGSRFEKLFEAEYISKDLHSPFRFLG